MGINFGYGLQMLVDSHQRFTRSGTPVWLRVKNFEDVGDFIEVGVPYTPTGAAAAQTGYTDIPITPPPDVQGVSLHNIGLNSERLQFGATKFIISHSFVEAQLALYDKIPDPIEVFRSRDGKNAAIGLFCYNRLYSIESITHKEVAGRTLVWYIIGNALELVSDSLSHSPDE